MEIFVYKGLYNLPSIDFECLRAIVSCSFNFSYWKSLNRFVSEFYSANQCTRYN